MNQSEVLKLMAEIGPDAKEAIDSWVHLQWAEFAVKTIDEIIACVVFIWIVICIKRAFTKD